MTGRTGEPRGEAATGEASTSEAVTLGTPEGQRVIELLWNARPASARGPRPKISLDEIVTAAVDLADEQGYEALSMRSLARHLGVGVMSLYTYVPGKTELFEVMIDRAYRERVRPERDLGWRERYTRHVREAVAMYRRHPWLLQSNLWRLPLGPHVLDVNEDLLAIAHDAGLARDVGVRVASLLESYAFGMARGEVADRDEARRTGESNDDFWNARAGFWETYFDPQRYPSMLATWEAGAYDGAVDPEADLVFAVDLILDSVAQLVSAATEGSDPSA